MNSSIGCRGCGAWVGKKFGRQGTLASMPRKQKSVYMKDECVSRKHARVYMEHGSVSRKRKSVSRKHGSVSRNQESALLA